MSDNDFPGNIFRPRRRGGYSPEPRDERPRNPPPSPPPGGRGGASPPLQIDLSIIGYIEKEGRPLTDEPTVNPPGDRILRHWWEQGALDEARMRNHGLTDEQRDVRDMLELLMRDNPRQPVAMTLARVLYIYLAGQPRRVRIRTIKRAVFGP